MQIYNEKSRANIAAIFALGRAAVKPKPKLNISEWAEKKRKISSAESARPGQYDNSLTPFAVEMMDAFIEPGVEKVSVMGPAQLVKTEVIKNVIGFYIDYNPCPIMYVSPTETTSREFSRTKLQPMIDNNEFLKLKVAKEKNRKSDATMHKQFINGHLILGGSNSPNALAQYSIKIALVDDSDRCPESAGTEGDPVKLVTERTESYALLGRKVGEFSTPTIEGVSRIERAYLQSDQREYFVPCPHCGHMQTLRFEQLKWEKEKDLTGKTINHLTDTAKYECESCKELIDEKHKWQMIQAGKWRAKYPERIRHRGYHINRLYSLFSNWGQIVERFIDAKDDPNLLRVFTNTVLAKTFKPVQSYAIEEGALLERVEDYMTAEKPYMPNGALVLTAAVDVQGDRLECEVKAWGKGFENWSIALEKFVGDPNQIDCWREMFEYIRNTIFTREDGLQKTIQIFFVDSSYLTERVYEMMEGTPRGWCIKGKEGDRPLIPSTYTKAYNKRIPLLTLGVDSGKLQVHEDLKIKEHGARFCHFSKNHNDYEYFRQLTAEKAVPKYSSRGGRIEWIKKESNRRNEAFDLAVYNLAAAVYLNPDFDSIANNDKKELEKLKEQKQNTTPAKKQNPFNGAVNNNYLNAGINQHVKW